MATWRPRATAAACGDALRSARRLLSTRGRVDRAGVSTARGSTTPSTGAACAGASRASAAESRRARAQTRSPAPTARVSPRESTARLTPCVAVQRQAAGARGLARRASPLRLGTGVSVASASARHVPEVAVKRAAAARRRHLRLQVERARDGTRRARRGRGTPRHDDRRGIRAAAGRCALRARGRGAGAARDGGTAHARQGRAAVDASAQRRAAGRRSDSSRVAAMPGRLFTDEPADGVLRVGSRTPRSAARWTTRSSTGSPRSSRPRRRAACC